MKQPRSRDEDDTGKVRFLTGGFNHQAFVLRFEQDGESLYPPLAEVIGSSPELRRRVRAALNGSREHVYQAALLDPNTGATLTTGQTVAVCDELIHAHRHLLSATLLR